MIMKTWRAYAKKVNFFDNLSTSSMRKYTSAFKIIQNKVTLSMVVMMV